MPTAHPLDRPVLSALAGRQAPLALRRGGAVRFDPAFAMFAALEEVSPRSLADLAHLVAAHGDVALVEADEPPPVPGTAVAARGVLTQMVADRPVAEAEPDGFAIIPLTEADAPEMLALALLTQPGPFFSRTHELGDFIGVKVGGRLAAMAGERMRPDGFTEVSGVCTHPDHRGRGHAAVLTRRVTAAIQARGETAYLHVYAHNAVAIRLYEQLGFSIRREMLMTSLTAV